MSIRPGVKFAQCQKRNIKTCVIKNESTVFRYRVIKMNELGIRITPITWFHAHCYMKHQHISALNILGKHSLSFIWYIHVYLYYTKQTGWTGVYNCFQILVHSQFPTQHSLSMQPKILVHSQFSTRHSLFIQPKILVHSQFPTQHSLSMQPKILVHSQFPTQHSLSMQPKILVPNPLSNCS